MFAQKLTHSLRRARLQALEQDSEEWLRARREDVKLSASEMASAIGHPKASHSRQHLWRYKTGRIAELSSPTPYLQRLLDHGKAEEPAAIAAFAALRPNSRAEKTGIWLLASDPRIGATPDALVTEGPYVVPLEVKCPFDADYETDALRREKDLIQLRTQMECVGSPYGYLFYYHRDGVLELIRAQRDADYWADIYRRAWIFLRYVERDEEPPRLSKAQKERDQHVCIPLAAGDGH